MSLHILGGTECNMGCEYCYEEPDREINDKDMALDYDMDAILSRLDIWVDEHPNQAPGLHGGEPLLMANDDIDTIFAYIDDHWDSPPTIQTNGSLIKDEHIELFKKYNVSVGMSCDGPPELNKLRKARHGGDDVTDEFSVRTNRAITRLVEEGISIGIITVLTTANAGTDEKLNKLLSWIDNLNRMGVNGHFNPAIPYDDVQNDVSLSPSRLKEVYAQTVEWMYAEEHREWGPFDRYQDNLMGLSLGNCVNNKCDVSNTSAARISKEDGELSGCGKTWETYGDGVPFLQGDSSDNEYGERVERYDMLKQLPGPHTGGEPDLGGCKGCKYWSVCQGGCPSSGIDEDWRNRTIWCEAKYSAYEQVESQLRSTLPNIRLITDLPWNVEISDEAQYGELDMKPFAKMRPDTYGPSSTTRHALHKQGTPLEAVGRDVLPDDVNPFDMKVKRWEEEVGAENIDVDYDEQVVRVDSSPTDECDCGGDCACESNTTDDGWKKVNQ